MRYIVLSSNGLSGSTVFFSKLCHKWHDLQKKKVIQNKMCVLIFSTNLSATFLILKRIQQDIIINVKRSSCKVLFILVILQ